MAIDLSQNIPEIWSVNDPESLREVLIAMKLSIEELARKAEPAATEG